MILDDNDALAPQAEEQIAQIRAAKKDHSAFYPLYLAYVNRIYCYILARVGSYQDAEDLSSEVFCRAIKQLHRFNECNSFAAWLFTIARNLTVDHYRTNKSVWLDLSAFDPPAEENAIDSETLLVLKDHLKKLDTKERDLLALRYAGRLTFVEIGQLLGKNPDTTRKAHNKILVRLRMNME